MPRLVPSIKRAFDVLDLVRRAGRPLSVPEIVKSLGFPRTTAHEIVNTLLEGDYLCRDENNPNRFSLGFGLFELGSAYSSKA